MKGIGNLIGFVVFWTAATVFTLGIALIPLTILLVLLFAGASGRADRAKKLLTTTLMPGEEIISQGIQHRVFSLLSRRALLAITNSRIVLMRRGLLGGFKMLDVQWKDLKDVRIEQNVWASACGSNLWFSNLNPTIPIIAVDGVPSDVASEMYSRAQFEEQAWEEKRRVRALEETRAASGGVYVNTPQPATAGATASSSNVMLEEIQQAKALLDAGAVSDAEFQEMKSKILAKF